MAPEQQTRDDDREKLNKYYTGPLSFPLHVLDESGEPLCGSMGNEQRRFISEHGVSRQPTVADRIERKDCRRPVVTVLNGLCGNCRRSLLSEIDSERLREAQAFREQVIDDD